MPPAMHLLCMCSMLVPSNFAHFQKNSKRLRRCRRRKSSIVPECGADFPAAIFLAGNAQTLAGIAFRAAEKSGTHFPAASKFAGKLFQQRISDSQSLLEFSDSCEYGPRKNLIFCTSLLPFREREKVAETFVQCTFSLSNSGA